VPPKTGSQDHVAEPIGTIQGGSMLFSEKLAALEQRVASAKDAVQAAAGESREQLKQRLDQAKVDVERVAKNAPRRGTPAGRIGHPDGDDGPPAAEPAGRFCVGVYSQEHFNYLLGTMPVTAARMTPSPDGPVLVLSIAGTS
jgi:hypothetical protein